MKTMSSITVLILFSVLASCKSKKFVQVFETKGLSTMNINGFHTFENDTLKITYLFNDEKGGMGICIKNKLTKPLYINWNKSTFESIAGKFSYNSINPKTIQEINYQYQGYNVVAVDTFTRASYGIKRVNLKNAVKIMPDSTYENIKFYLLPVKYYPISKGAKTQEVKLHEFPEQQVTTYVEEFNSKDSPIYFNNIIAFSLSPHFGDEFQVKNEFYVNRIEEMPYNHFFHVARDKNGKITNKKYYRNHYFFGTQFYIIINDKNSYRRRYKT